MLSVVLNIMFESKRLMLCTTPWVRILVRLTSSENHSYPLQTHYLYVLILKVNFGREVFLMATVQSNNNWTYVKITLLTLIVFLKNSEESN